MKKLFVLIAAVGLSFHALALDPINEKLLQSFKESFPNAEKVSWHELNSTFVVTFVEENNRAKAYFDKEGVLVQLIRYYSESHLPFSILNVIKKQFSGKKIFGVTEVTSIGTDKNLQTEYFVKLEDGRSWTTVKVDINGNTVVTEKVRKA
jgi:hypothetical protein